MNSPVRVGIYGTGRTAAELLAGLPHTPFVLTSAIVHSPEKAGRDIGELVGQEALGVPATTDLDAALASGTIDVLLYAGLTGEHHLHAMTACAQAGVDQVHAGFVDPRAALAPEDRTRIEAAAQASGSRIVGTGMMPGLWIDVLPSLLASGLPAPVSVHCKRISNISSWGRDVLAHEFNVGTTTSGPSWRADSLLRESARLVADALGLAGCDLRSEGGLVAATAESRVGDTVVRPGEVKGFDQAVVLSDGGVDRVRLEWAGFGEPVAASSGDADVTLRLTGGDATELVVRVSAPVDPYPGTAARMLHAVRGVRTLPGGLHAPTALPSA